MNVLLKHQIWLSPMWFSGYNDVHDQEPQSDQPWFFYLYSSSVYFDLIENDDSVSNECLYCNMCELLGLILRNAKAHKRCYRH